MAVKNPQFEINLRKNDNMKSTAYGKYYPKAVDIRFRPEGVDEDNITSRNFKGQCALTTYGVEEKIDLTPEEQDPDQKVYIKKVTPLDDWIQEQTQA